VVNDGLSILSVADGLRTLSDGDLFALQRRAHVAPEAADGTPFVMEGRLEALDALARRLFERALDDVRVRELSE
jgi:hypothetical protein